MLDAGALSAFERNDRKVGTLIGLGVSRGATLHVPGGMVAQVWREGSRQVRLARLVGLGVLQVQPLDRAEAQAIGALCGMANASDVVDASVVLLARRHGASVVTSDRDDLARIDAGLTFVSC